MKRRTGNTKVARTIALALATVVAVTSVPVAALAEGDDSPQVQPVIVVEDPSEGAAEGATVTLDFSSENVTDDTKEVVVEAQQSYDEAGNAETAANAAAEAAANAATYAGNAEQAATNAETVANAAQALADTLIGKNAIDMTAVDKSVEAAETAVGDANSAIATYNSNVNDVNAKIDLANNSKNDDEKTGALGTDSLIAAATNEGEGSAQAAVNAAIQDAEDNYVKKEVIENVRSEVGTADQAYVDADTNAKTALATINQNLTTALTGTDIVANAKTAADNAEKAKEEAVKHQDSASKALDKTVENYNEVKKLVESNSHDVAAANKFAQDAATAAVEARNAADNAEKAAKAASEAADVAKQKRDAAKTAVDNATKDLNDAWSVFKKAYAKAEDLADTADGKVEDLVGDGKGKKGKIETANEKIETAKTAVSNFNNTEVKNANDAIKNTNGLIDAAQQAIDGLDPVEAKKITDAIDAVTNAQDALDAANEDLAEAQESYNNSLKEKKTAAQYADEANTAANNADGQLTEMYKQIALVEASERVTKDNLSNMLQHTDYSSLEASFETATGDFKKSFAEGEQDPSKVTVPSDLDTVILGQATIITNKTNELNGLNTQLNNLDNEIDGYAKTIETYEGYIKNNPGKITEKQAKLPELEQAVNDAQKDYNKWGWAPGAHAYYSSKLNTAKRNLQDAKDDIETWNNQITEANNNIAGLRTSKASAVSTKSQVESDIEAARNAKDKAEERKTAAENLKTVTDKKASVDAFTVNEDNTAVLTAREVQMIKDIIAAYGNKENYAKYDINTEDEAWNADKSWVAMDGDTSVYKHVKDGTWVGDGIADFVNFWSNLFTDHDAMEGDMNKREKAIEAKYSATGNVLLVWDNEEGLI